jgi:hypothetical protein
MLDIVMGDSSADAPKADAYRCRVNLRDRIWVPAMAARLWTDDPEIQRHLRGRHCVAEGETAERPGYEPRC